MLEVFIRLRQTEKYFVGFVFVLECGRIKRLNEVNIEVPLWLGGGTIIRRTEEQVAVAIDAVLLPFNRVLPYLMASDVGMLVPALHQFNDCAVIGSIKRVLRERLCSLLNLGVVVNILFQIEVVLFSFRCLRNELAIDGLYDLPQGCLNGSQQVIGRISTQVFDAGLVKTQSIAQFLGSGTNLIVDVPARRQAMCR